SVGWHNTVQRTFIARNESRSLQRMLTSVDVRMISDDPIHPRWRGGARSHREAVMPNWRTSASGLRSPFRLKHLAGQDLCKLSPFRHFPDADDAVAVHRRQPAAVAR